MPGCGTRTTTVERPVNEPPPSQTAIDSAFLDVSIGQLLESHRQRRAAVPNRLTRWKTENTEKRHGKQFSTSAPEEQGQLAAVEEVNRQRLEGWWAMVGEEPHYPIGTAEAAAMLQRADYDLSADTLLAWSNQGVLPPVPLQSGRPAWNATNIVTAAAAAEARRKWKPFSTIHGHKLTMIEKIHQIAEHQGGSAFKDLAAFDIEGLLGVLVDVSCDRGAVQVMAEAIRTKLKEQGVI